MTPASIGDMMAARLFDGTFPDGETPSVIDPACGTGELLLAAHRACPAARLFGCDVDQRMVSTAIANLSACDASADGIRRVSMFDAESLGLHGRYDAVIGNPPYFVMRKDDDRLRGRGVSGFASLQEAGRLNAFALFIEYSLLLLRDGGRMVLLVPPSVNNGAYFRRIRRRMLELGRIESIGIIRDSHVFGDAMTAVEIVTMSRTDDGFVKNARASEEWLWDANDDGSDLVLTDDKAWLSSFCVGKTTISERGFAVRTGSVIWNQHKAEFSDADGSGMLRCVFARDVTADGTLVMSGRISAPGHYLPLSAARIDNGPAVVVNRIVSGIDRPSLRFAMIPEGMRFFAENHVNVITGGDEDDTKGLYDSLRTIQSKDLSRYLRAVTGNTQLSARELGRLPLGELRQ